MCLLNLAGIYVDEDDIAMYTIKAIDDPRTLNKTVYIRPPENILSQREVVQIWEKLIGKELPKSSISAEQFLSSMEGEINIIGSEILLIIYNIHTTSIVQFLHTFISLVLCFLICHLTLKSKKAINQDSKKLLVLLIFSITTPQHTGTHTLSTSQLYLLLVNHTLLVSLSFKFYLIFFFFFKKILNTVSMCKQDNHMKCEVEWYTTTIFAWKAVSQTLR